MRLVVADTGPGIPAEHLPRVFERFYRVDAGRSRELGGTGLGLSIVKHMVETMRGRVAVESTVGKGSTFVVSLQRVDVVASPRRTDSAGARSYDVTEISPVASGSSRAPANLGVVSLVHIAVATTAVSFALYATMLALFARAIAKRRGGARRVGRRRG